MLQFRAHQPSAGRPQSITPERIFAVTLQQWLDQWQHKSHEVQNRVRVAHDFLQKHYAARGDDDVLSRIRCIDFSHAVEMPTLSRGRVLVGMKDPRVSPYRSAYFTEPGHPVRRLGVASIGNLRTDPTVLEKIQNRYEVMVDIPVGEVLKSTCAPAADTRSVQKSRILADGGGLQYEIPNMNRYLRFVHHAG